MLAQDKTFCFGVPGSTATIEISADGLRGILGQVEAELYRSEVYRRAVTNLQQASTEGGASAQFLLKAVGREAIRLALRHFLRQQEAETKQPVNAVEAGTPSTAIVVPEAPSTGAVAVPQAVAKAATGQRPLLGAIAQFKLPKKPTAAELAAETAQKQQAAFLALGEQIRQARQARALSLEALQLKSLVQMHHLKALEAGDYAHLPEMIYLRGFIHRIAPVLGLDSATLLALLPSDATPYAVRRVGLAPTKPSHKSAFGGLGGSPLPLYVGYATLMTGGFVWLSHQSAPKSTLPPLEIDTPRVRATPTPATSTSTTTLRKVTPPMNGKLSVETQQFKAGRTIANVAPPETMKF
jgi:cytoskeleton protein RodZ